jgi:hypothetical protein
MESVFADIRQSLRMLKKSPGSTAVAIAALALGIGANTGIFTVINKVILEPLPYPESDRLVKVYWVTAAARYRSTTAGFRLYGC